MGLAKLLKGFGRMIGQWLDFTFGYRLAESVSSSFTTLHRPASRRTDGPLGRKTEWWKNGGMVGVFRNQGVALRWVI
jgi:hypothetical protein